MKFIALCMKEDGEKRLCGMKVEVGLRFHQDKSLGPWSGADEAGVEGAGESDVGGALDEAAAVGKEGEGVGRAFEAEEEVVIANGTMGDEAVAHSGEVDGAVVLVDLDGVAAAEGDVGAAFA